MTVKRDKGGVRSGESGTDYRASRLFLVGAERAFAAATVGCLVRSGDEVVRACAESPRDSVWIARKASGLLALVGMPSRRSTDRRLLLLDAPAESTQQLLHVWYRHVLCGGRVSLPALPELIEILAAPNRDELFVAGEYDATADVVVLHRGTLEPLVVRASWFRAESAKRARHPGNIVAIDHGQTVKVADREIAADAILYEFDPGFRKAARKRSCENDDSLGGSIRRLRLQRGLTQADVGLPARTMARIERGSVSRPHQATLRTIARRLRVPVEELGSY